MGSHAFRGLRCREVFEEVFQEGQGLDLVGLGGFHQGEIKCRTLVVRYFPMRKAACDRSEPLQSRRMRTGSSRHLDMSLLTEMKKKDVMELDA